METDRRLEENIISRGLRPVKYVKGGEKYNGHSERNFIGEQKTVLCDGEVRRAKTDE